LISGKHESPAENVWQWSLDDRDDFVAHLAEREGAGIVEELRLVTGDQDSIADEAPDLRVGFDRLV
jgi:hypothetical protein